MVATATSKMYPGNVCLREVAMLASTADIGRIAADSLGPTADRAGSDLPI